MLLIIQIILCWLFLAYQSGFPTTKEGYVARICAITFGMAIGWGIMYLFKKRRE